MSEEQQKQARTGMLERSMLILRAFRPNDVAVSPTTLARRAGLPKATGHRIIAEMLDLGVLERTAGGVRLGMMLFEIGQLVPRQRVMRRIALPIMANLRESTKLSVHLAVLDQGDALYIEILSYRQDLPSRVGGRMPAYATAVGKAMLAFSGEEELEAVRGRRFRRFGPNTLPSMAALERELLTVREEGVAFEREESGPGVACAGAPIRGSSGEIRGGLSLTGRAEDFDPRRVGAAVRTAALTLGQLIERGMDAQAASFATIMQQNPLHSEASGAPPASVSGIRRTPPERTPEP